MAYDDPWPESRPVDAHRLLAAERGTLTYDTEQYPVHAVPNVVLALIWGGLLADGHGAVTLTGAGRARLALERAAGHCDDDPPPTAPTPVPVDLEAFTATDAAWIRGHAWNLAMRGLYEAAGFFTLCACQGSGSEKGCTARGHRCWGGSGPAPETHVYERSDGTVLRPAGDRAVPVWLSDRTCRSKCPCGCHTGLLTPTPTTAPVAVATVAIQQLDLFA